MELSSVFIIIFSLVVVYILYKYWARDKKSPAENQQSNLNRGPQVEVESITKSLLPNERGESNTEEYTEYAEGEDTTKYQSTFHRLSNNVKLNFKWANKAGFESIKKVTLDWNIKRGDAGYVNLLTHTYEGEKPQLKNFTEHEVFFSNLDFKNKEDKKDLRGIHQLVLKAYSKDTNVVHTLYTSPLPDADEGCKICKVTEEDLNLTMELVEAKNFVFTAQSSGFVKDTDVVEHPMYILNPKTFAPLNHMPFGSTFDYTVGLETELEPTGTTNIIYIKAKTTKTSNKDEFKYLFWNGTTKKLSWESGTTKRTKFYIEEFVDDVSSNATTKRTLFSLATDTTKVLGYDKTNKKLTLINYFDIQADMNKLEAALWLIKYRNNDDRKPVFKIICGRFDDHNIDNAGMLYLYMTKGSPSSRYTMGDNNTACTGENVCISILSNKNTEKTADGSYVTTEYPGYQMYYMDVGSASLSNITTNNPTNRDRYLFHDINPEEDSSDWDGWNGLYHDGGGVRKRTTSVKLKCYEEYYKVGKATWKLKPSEIPSLQEHCNKHGGVCWDNTGKENVCRYGALSTGIIPFNKVWNMGPFGKSANKGSVPPIFRLINKKIDDNLMVTFQVGWYNSDGGWTGFDSINPVRNANSINWTTGENNNRADLWDNTDNTKNPGILKFEEDGGITVVTQWPAVASDTEIVDEGYRGIKFYMGTSSEQYNKDPDNIIKTNEEFFKISQF